MNISLALDKEHHGQYQHFATPVNDKLLERNSIDSLTKKKGN
ncbi:hypothetical protein [Paraglaciecola sp. 20A4]|nr:hypothetical protein [Paraglaciecola sp. 20A4]